MSSFNDRFTVLADSVTEATGRWVTSVVALVLILLWFATGPLFHFSDTWQLLVNTPTTIVELFLGFFACAAANRVERRNRELSNEHQATLNYIKAKEEFDARMLTRIEQMEERILREMHPTASPGPDA